jgi:predicted alpha/beta hydrolase
MNPLGEIAAGTLLPKKFLIVIPNEQYYSGDVVAATMGGSSKNFMKLSRSYWFPVANLDLSQTFERAEGAQVQIPVTFNTQSDDVWCAHGYNGIFDSMTKLTKSVS